MRKTPCLMPLAVLLTACSLIPCHPYRLGEGPGETRARMTLGDDEQADGRFVGVAVSGGGSRAANFGAAALLELKALNLLDQIDVLSSVSGGGLAATYLALDEHEYFSFFPPFTRKIEFTEENAKDVLSTHFQRWYLLHLFFPWNIVKSFNTTFNRTDIMFDVFDAWLLHGATFADLTKLRSRPKLLLNAADRDDLQRFNLAEGRLDQKFVFADDHERIKHADLGPLPLSVAVTASAAVPGFYNNVTLAVPGQNNYLHLMDGAVTDDTGILTLVGVLQKALKEGTYKFPNGCVLISIDASPNFRNWHRDVDETRGWKDYLFDLIASDAIDYILRHQREEVLELVGMDHAKQARQVKTTEFTIPGTSQTCHFWYIAVRHIDPDSTLGQELTRIPTELEITNQQQDALFHAAIKLVRDGWSEAAARFQMP